MSDLELQFLKNQANEAEGLGDAGIETFRDSPFVSCGREAAQNALDAVEQNPVRMIFREHNVSTEQVPGIDKLRETISVCLKAAQESGSEKDQDYFKNADSVVSEDVIPILEIADFNTTGLEGPPNVNPSKFHALVKSNGVPNKDTDTSAGSFGIGKNASFAVSDLRTVFYSTVYGSADDLRFAMQGKVKLVSHDDVGGTKRSATAYYGYPKGFAAVENQKLVPEWLRRTSKGTSVFSIGFRGHKNWVDRMTVPLLSNFFLAVDDGKINFEIGNGENSRIINTETITALLEDEAIEQVADEASYGESLRLARQLYLCRKSSEALKESFEVNNLGNFKATILVQEGMPKTVAILRNGMLIATSLEYFGDKFARFPGARDFIMLVEPENNEASKVLKSLENPKHDGFSIGRLDDPAKQKKVNSGIKGLIKNIRKIIKENAEITGGDSIKLDELGEFFADTGDDESKIPSAEDDPETYTYKPSTRLKPKRKKRVAKNDKGDEGGKGHRSGNGGGNTDGNGDGTGSGEGGDGTRGGIENIELKSIRNIEKSANIRKVFFTPDEAGDIKLTFSATGIYSSNELKVENVSGAIKCSAKQGRVELNADKGVRIEIEVTFDEAYTGPLEVHASRSMT